MRLSVCLHLCPFTCLSVCVGLSVCLSACVRACACLRACVSSVSTSSQLALKSPWKMKESHSGRTHTDSHSVLSHCVYLLSSNNVLSAGSPLSRCYKWKKRHLIPLARVFLAPHFFLRAAAGLLCAIVRVCVAAAARGWHSGRQMAISLPPI